MTSRAHLTADKDFAVRILKVNHAGEHGAVNIYSGQLLVARVTARHMLAELTEFRSHERKHRAIFLAQLQGRGLRRCRGYWLCGVGGFTLGLLTGLCGAGAIAATTVAVERVVLGHLARQLEALQGKDEEAVAAISAIVAEEQQHCDRSAAQLAPGQFWPTVLSPIVSLSTQAVIWVGMHV
jgi:ubiquinone biosynthesis monooxygenase Coq7